MPHPMRRRAPQLAREYRVVHLDRVGGGMEETVQHLPQALGVDAAGHIEMAEWWRVLRRACGAYGQTVVNQVLVQRKPRERGQYHLASFRDLADEMPPPLAVRVGFDASECDADQLNRTRFLNRSS